MTSTHANDEQNVNNTAEDNVCKGNTSSKNINFESISNVQYAERASVLSSAWDAATEPIASSTLLHNLHRITLLYVLQEEWSKLDSCQKDNLRSNVEKCMAALEVVGNQGGCRRLRHLLEVSREPWKHPMLKDIMEGRTPSKADVEQWCRDEGVAGGLERLRQLCVAGSACVGAALRMARALLTLEHTHGARKTALDTMLVLLFKKGDTRTCIGEIKALDSKEVISVIGRLSVKNKTSGRLWKHAHDTALLCAQVTVAACLVKPLQEGELSTLCGQLSSLYTQHPDRLPAVLRKLLQSAETALHIYTVCRAVQHQFADTMRPFICELYIRALTTGMNELERQKLIDENSDAVKSTSQALARWFINLADYLSSNKSVSAECILTAFSLYPSKQYYNRVHECSKWMCKKDASIKEADKTTTDASISEATDAIVRLGLDGEVKDSANATDSSIVKTLPLFSDGIGVDGKGLAQRLVSGEVLDAEGLGLEAGVCRDLAVLLSGPRLKMLTWELSWEDLSRHCLSYMEDTAEGTKAVTTELKFVRLDYSQFEYQEPEVHDIYFGIEKGYEHHLEVEEDDEEDHWENEQPVRRYRRDSEESISNSDSEILSKKISKQNKKKAATAAKTTEAESEATKRTKKETKKEKKKPDQNTKIKCKVKKKKEVGDGGTEKERKRCVNPGIPVNIKVKPFDEKALNLVPPPPSLLKRMKASGSNVESSGVIRSYDLSNIDDMKALLNAKNVPNKNSHAAPKRKGVVGRLIAGTTSKADSQIPATTQAPSSPVLIPKTSTSTAPAQNYNTNYMNNLTSNLYQRCGNMNTPSTSTQQEGTRVSMFRQQMDRYEAWKNMQFEREFQQFTTKNEPEDVNKLVPKQENKLDFQSTLSNFIQGQSESQLNVLNSIVKSEPDTHVKQELNTHVIQELNIHVKQELNTHVKQELNIHVKQELNTHVKQEPNTPQPQSVNVGQPVWRNVTNVNNNRPSMFSDFIEKNARSIEEKRRQQVMQQSALAPEEKQQKKRQKKRPSPTLFEEALKEIKNALDTTPIPTSNIVKPSLATSNNVVPLNVPSYTNTDSLLNRPTSTVPFSDLSFVPATIQTRKPNTKPTKILEFTSSRIMEYDYVSPLKIAPDVLKNTSDRKNTTTICPASDNSRTSTPKAHNKVENLNSLNAACISNNKNIHYLNSDLNASNASKSIAAPENKKTNKSPKEGRFTHKMIEELPVVNIKIANPYGVQINQVFKLNTLKTTMMKVDKPQPNSESSNSFDRLKTLPEVSIHKLASKNTPESAKTEKETFAQPAINSPHVSPVKQCGSPKNAPSAKEMMSDLKEKEILINNAMSVLQGKSSAALSNNSSIQAFLNEMKTMVNAGLDSTNNSLSCQDQKQTSLAKSDEFIFHSMQPVQSYQQHATKKNALTKSQTLNSNIGVDHLKAEIKKEAVPQTYARKNYSSLLKKQSLTTLQPVQPEPPIRQVSSSDNSVILRMPQVASGSNSGNASKTAMIAEKSVDVYSASTSVQSKLGVPDFNVTSKCSKKSNSSKKSPKGGGINNKESRLEMLKKPIKISMAGLPEKVDLSKMLLPPANIPRNFKDPSKAATVKRKQMKKVVKFEEQSNVSGDKSNESWTPLEWGLRHVKNLDTMNIAQPASQTPLPSFSTFGTKNDGTSRAQNVIPLAYSNSNLYPVTTTVTTNAIKAQNKETNNSQPCSSRHNTVTNVAVTLPNTLTYKTDASLSGNNKNDSINHISINNSCSNDNVKNLLLYRKPKVYIGTHKPGTVIVKEIISVSQPNKQTQQQPLDKDFTDVLDVIQQDLQMSFHVAKDGRIVAATSTADNNVTKRTLNIPLVNVITPTSVVSSSAPPSISMKQTNEDWKTVERLLEGIDGTFNWQSTKVQRSNANQNRIVNDSFVTEKSRNVAAMENSKRNDDCAVPMTTSSQNIQNRVSPNKDTNDVISPVKDNDLSNEILNDMLQNAVENSSCNDLPQLPDNILNDLNLCDVPESNLKLQESSLTEGSEAAQSKEPTESSTKVKNNDKLDDNYVVTMDIQKKAEISSSISHLDDKDMIDYTSDTVAAKQPFLVESKSDTNSSNSLSLPCITINASNTDGHVDVYVETIDSLNRTPDSAVPEISDNTIPETSGNMDLKTSNNDVPKTPDESVPNVSEKVTPDFSEKSISVTSEQCVETETSNSIINETSDDLISQTIEKVISEYSAKIISKPLDKVVSKIPSKAISKISDKNVAISEATDKPISETIDRVISKTIKKVISDGDAVSKTMDKVIPETCDKKKPTEHISCNTSVTAVNVPDETSIKTVSKSNKVITQDRTSDSQVVLESSTPLDISPIEDTRKDVESISDVNFNMIIDQSLDKSKNDNICTTEPEQEESQIETVVNTNVPEQEESRIETVVNTNEPEQEESLIETVQNTNVPEQEESRIETDVNTNELEQKESQIKTDVNTNELEQEESRIETAVNTNDCDTSSNNSYDVSMFEIPKANNAVITSEAHLIDESKIIVSSTAEILNDTENKEENLNKTAVEVTSMAILLPFEDPPDKMKKKSDNAKEIIEGCPIVDLTDTSEISSTVVRLPNPSVLNVYKHEFNKSKDVLLNKLKVISSTVKLLKPKEKVESTAAKSSVKTKQNLAVKQNVKPANSKVPSISSKGYENTRSTFVKSSIIGSLHRKLVSLKKVVPSQLPAKVLNMTQFINVASNTATKSPQAQKQKKIPAKVEADAVIDLLSSDDEVNDPTSSMKVTIKPQKPRLLPPSFIAMVEIPNLCSKSGNSNFKQRRKKKKGDPYMVIAHGIGTTKVSAITNEDLEKLKMVCEVDLLNNDFSILTAVSKENDKSTPLKVPAKSSKRKSCEIESTLQDIQNLSFDYNDSEKSAANSPPPTKRRCRNVKAKTEIATKSTVKTRNAKTRSDKTSPVQNVNKNSCVEQNDKSSEENITDVICLSEDSEKEDDSTVKKDSKEIEKLDPKSDITIMDEELVIVENPADENEVFSTENIADETVEKNIVTIEEVATVSNLHLCNYDENNQDNGVFSSSVIEKVNEVVDLSIEQVTKDVDQQIVSSELSECIEIVDDDEIENNVAKTNEAKSDIDAASHILEIVTMEECGENNEVSVKESSNNAKEKFDTQDSSVDVGDLLTEIKIEDDDSYDPNNFTVPSRPNSVLTNINVSSDSDEVPSSTTVNNEIVKTKSPYNENAGVENQMDVSAGSVVENLESTITDYQVVAEEKVFALPESYKEDLTSIANADDCVEILDQIDQIKSAPAVIGHEIVESKQKPAILDSYALLIEKIIGYKYSMPIVKVERLAIPVMNLDVRKPLATKIKNCDRDLDDNDDKRKRSKIVLKDRTPVKELEDSSLGHALNNSKIFDVSMVCEGLESSNLDTSNESVEMKDAVSQVCVADLYNDLVSQTDFAATVNHDSNVHKSETILQTICDSVIANGEKLQTIDDIQDSVGQTFAQASETTDQSVLDDPQNPAVQLEAKIVDKSDNTNESDPTNTLIAKINDLQSPFTYENKEEYDDPLLVECKDDDSKTDVSDINNDSEHKIDIVDLDKGKSINQIKKSVSSINLCCDTSENVINTNLSIDDSKKERIVVKNEPEHEEDHENLEMDKDISGQNKKHIDFMDLNSDDSENLVSADSLVSNVSEQMRLSKDEEMINNIDQVEDSISTIGRSPVDPENMIYDNSTKDESKIVEDMSENNNDIEDQGMGVRSDKINEPTNPNDLSLVDPENVIDDDSTIDEFKIIEDMSENKNDVEDQEKKNRIDEVDEPTNPNDLSLADPENVIDDDSTIDESKIVEDMSENKNDVEDQGKKIKSDEVDKPINSMDLSPADPENMIDDNSTMDEFKTVENILENKNDIEDQRKEIRSDEIKEPINPKDFNPVDPENIIDNDSTIDESKIVKDMLENKNDVEDQRKEIKNDEINEPTNSTDLSCDDPESKVQIEDSAKNFHDISLSQFQDQNLTPKIGKVCDLESVLEHYPEIETSKIQIDAKHDENLIFEDEIDRLIIKVEGENEEIEKDLAEKNSHNTGAPFSTSTPTKEIEEIFDKTDNKDKDPMVNESDFITDFNKFEEMISTNRCEMNDSTDESIEYITFGNENEVSPMKDLNSSTESEYRFILKNPVKTYSRLQKRKVPLVKDPKLSRSKLSKINLPEKRDEINTMPLNDNVYDCFTVKEVMKLEDVGYENVQSTEDFSYEDMEIASIEGANDDKAFLADFNILEELSDGNDPRDSFYSPIFTDDDNILNKVMEEDEFIVNNLDVEELKHRSEVRNNQKVRMLERRKKISKYTREGFGFRSDRDDSSDLLNGRHEGPAALSDSPNPRLPKTLNIVSNGQSQGMNNGNSHEVNDNNLKEFVMMQANLENYYNNSSMVLKRVGKNIGRRTLVTSPLTEESLEKQLKKLVQNSEMKVAKKVYKNQSKLRRDFVKDILSRVPGMSDYDHIRIPQPNVIVNVVQVGQLPVSSAQQSPLPGTPTRSNSTNEFLEVAASNNSEYRTHSNDEQSGQSQENDSQIIKEVSSEGSPQPEQQNQNQDHSIVECPAVVETNESSEQLKVVATTSESQQQSTVLQVSSAQETITLNPTMTSPTTNSVPISNSNNPSLDGQVQLIFAPQSMIQQNFIASENQEHKEVDSNTEGNVTNIIQGATASTPVSNFNPVSRAQTLVNILSQKIIRPPVSGVNTSQVQMATFPKGTPINALSLQQALAQILPPPLSQASGDGSQTLGHPTGPQVVHIVQGKAAGQPGGSFSGLLMDNSQQAVVSVSGGAQVLHIVQGKNTMAGNNATVLGQSQLSGATFGGLSLVDGGTQQGGNQVLHILNTGAQSKNSTATAQLLKRVNLLTSLTNSQGNEQKMVQFVCKSADGKSIQLNAQHQRGMVLRLQPIETPTSIAQQQKSVENQATTANATIIQQVPKKSPTSTEQSQEIKSRSIYEENYAKFIQNSKLSPISTEKSSTILPKFNQAFGKSIYQESVTKTESEANQNVTGEQSQELTNAISLAQMGQLSSPPLLIRKTHQPGTAQNIVGQVKQGITPMNIQTMHGGVIYTGQIPVNIGGGQTINLITVPSTKLLDEAHLQAIQKQVQEKNSEQQQQSQQIEQQVIKLVPQNDQNQQNVTLHVDTSSEDANQSFADQQQSNINTHPLLAQMRIKVPMLSKGGTQMVTGTRVVRPVLQIQRNIIPGTNPQVYQQLVLTTAPALRPPTPAPQQPVRPPRPPTATTPQQQESNLSSSTLEQLREFDMVLEQVKERSTVQPGSNSNSTFSESSPRQNIDSEASVQTSQPTIAQTPQREEVLYSIGPNHTVNVTYVNKNVLSGNPTVLTTSYPQNQETTTIVNMGQQNSPQIQIGHALTNSINNSNKPTTPTKINNKSMKPKTNKPPTVTPSSSKASPVAPKTSVQKPLEDEQTTQRILYILAEYKEQVENSPDKDKPAPRRRSNPPTNPSTSSKRKKGSGSSSKKGSNGQSQEMSPLGDDTGHTMGSEDSSCGLSQGECADNSIQGPESQSPQGSPQKAARKLVFPPEQEVSNPPVTQPQRNVIIADGQNIVMTRPGPGGKATAVLMPTNYLLPMSMVKGGQQIAIVTNQGPKILNVPQGEGGATNTLFLQRLIGPAGLKPMLARPGQVRQVRLPANAVQNLQAFNLTTAQNIASNQEGSWLSGQQVINAQQPKLVVEYSPNINVNHDLNPDSVKSETSDAQSLKEENMSVSGGSEIATPRHSEASSDELNTKNRSSDEGMFSGQTDSATDDSVQSTLHSQTDQILHHIQVTKAPTNATVNLIQVHSLNPNEPGKIYSVQNPASLGSLIRLAGKTSLRQTFQTINVQGVNQDLTTKVSPDVQECAQNLLLVRKHFDGQYTLAASSSGSTLRDVEMKNATNLNQLQQDLQVDASPSPGSQQNYSLGHSDHLDDNLAKVDGDGNVSWSLSSNGSRSVVHGSGDGASPGYVTYSADSPSGLVHQAEQAEVSLRESEHDRRVLRHEYSPDGGSPAPSTPRHLYHKMFISSPDKSDHSNVQDHLKKDDHSQSSTITLHSSNSPSFTIHHHHGSHHHQHLASSSGGPSNSGGGNGGGSSSGTAGQSHHNNSNNHHHHQNSSSGTGSSLSSTGQQHAVGHSSSHHHSARLGDTRTPHHVLRHKYALMEHELRLQKSLSEECEDLGVDSPSASDLFPEADLLFANSPSSQFDHSQDGQMSSVVAGNSSTTGGSGNNVSNNGTVSSLSSLHGASTTGTVLGLREENLGPVEEEFARMHPNTTFHSGEIDILEEQDELTFRGTTKRSTIRTIPGRRNEVVRSVIEGVGSSGMPSIYQPNKVTTHFSLVGMPKRSSINIMSLQSSDDNSEGAEDSMNSAESKDGLVNNKHLDGILNSNITRDVNLSASDSPGCISSNIIQRNVAQVIRHASEEQMLSGKDGSKLCDENSPGPQNGRSFLLDNSSDVLPIDVRQGDPMILKTLGMMDRDGRDGLTCSSPEQHSELFWESNSNSNQSDEHMTHGGTNLLDFSSEDSNKCCKSPPSCEETNSTDSSSMGGINLSSDKPLRLNSVIKTSGNTSTAADGPILHSALTSNIPIVVQDSRKLDLHKSDSNTSTSPDAEAMDTSARKSWGRSLKSSGVRRVLSPRSLSTEINMGAEIETSSSEGVNVLTKSGPAVIHSGSSTPEDSAIVGRRASLRGSNHTKRSCHCCAPPSPPAHPANNTSSSNTPGGYTTTSSSVSSLGHGNVTGASLGLGSTITTSAPSRVRNRRRPHPTSH